MIAKVHHILSYLMLYIKWGREVSPQIFPAYPTRTFFPHFHLPITLLQSPPPITTYWLPPVIHHTLQLAYDHPKLAQLHFPSTVTKSCIPMYPLLIYYIMWFKYWSILWRKLLIPLSIINVQLIAYIYKKVWYIIIIKCCV